MKLALTICACALLMTLSALGIVCILLVKDARQLVQDLPQVMDGAISREGDKTRAIIGHAAARAMERGDKHMSEFRSDFRVAVGQVSTLIDSRSLALQQATVAEIRAARKDLHPPLSAATALIHQYAGIPAIVGQRLDPWTNCNGNGACWQAQATAMLGAGRVTLGETSRTMRTVREAAPAIAGSATDFSATLAERSKHSGLRLFFRGLK